MTGPPPAYPPTRTTSRGAHLVVAAGIGLVAALVLYVIRAPLSRSLAAGVVFAVGSFVLLRASEVPALAWPATPPSKADELGQIQRWRLNGFDALTHRPPGLSPDLRRRLAALASAIAARRHVVIGSPAAIALLGRGHHDLLFPPERAEGDPRPDPPTSAQLIDLIDRLLELGSSSPSEGP
ncbi:hypothetical protein SAMN04515671_2739 [Nakamurella panacisegetis]|uniref:Uncharacterized protein n=1 Tax=Nakamurella panacisegetis TaxID=1090615 RepID=A0A1H0PF22_9ACTN|nr:hypothetical protein [Nakamurella panacisegetis]SDP03350.1 hypothetical protein SAMN04515671_2739 [Nakamurella panacisegetis]